MQRRPLSTRVSYIVKDNYADTRHSSGINALALDVFTPSSTAFGDKETTAESGFHGAGILYSGGRDATINAWDLHVDFAGMREDMISKTSARDQPSTNSRRFSVTGRDSSRLTSPPSNRKFSARNSTPDWQRSPPGSPITAKHPTSDPFTAALAATQSSSSSLGGRDSPESGRKASFEIGSPRPASILHSDFPSSPPHMQGSPINPPVYGRSPPVYGSLRRATGGGGGLGISSDAVESVVKKDDSYRKSRASMLAMGKGVNGRSGSFADAEIKERISAAKPFTSPPNSTFLRSFQAHSDWVNDIVLCNRNQNLISASSDRMIYLWSVANPTVHYRLGHHLDYVKALAYSSGSGWVASAGLDRRIVLWDVGEGRGEAATLNIPSPVICHDNSPSTSVYALACNPAGSVIVSGSPDKIVKVWDPRSGKDALGLKGHSDIVRALLVSDDGKWVVSASSDTTVKLWSLAQPQRPMMTYTHCNDPVWCLYSNHPDLDTFWSGSKDGWVTKMSRRRVGGDGRGRVDDELVDCVAVCKESGPVSRLVAVDDLFVWTATNHSNVNRWRDVPFGYSTVVNSPEEMVPDTDTVYIPVNSIIRQNRGLLLDDTESFRFSMTSSVDNSVHNTVTANPVSIASIHPMIGRSVEEPEEEDIIEPVFKSPDYVIPGTPSITRVTLLNDKWHVVTEDSDGRIALWDIIRCKKVKDCADKDYKYDSAKKETLFDAVVTAENSFEWVANWCTIDIKNGFMMIHLENPKCFEAEIYHEVSGCDIAPTLEDQRVNLGKWILSHLFLCYTHCCYQQIPSAAIFNHDIYLGDLSYAPLVKVETTEPYQLPIHTPGTPLVFGSTVVAPSLQRRIPPSNNPSINSPPRIQSPPPNSNQQQQTTSEISSSIETPADGNGDLSQASSPAVSRSQSRAGSTNTDLSAIEQQAITAVEAVVKTPVAYQPNVEEVPSIHIPPDVPIILSIEENANVACYIDQFRSTVVSLGWARETARFTECIPPWVYDCIMDRPVVRDPPKLSFIMAPHPNSGLPDLPSNANKLSSNRMIRIRKLVAYVAERLDIYPSDEMLLFAKKQLDATKPAPEEADTATSSSSSTSTPTTTNGFKHSRTESGNTSNGETSNTSRFTSFFSKKAEPANTSPSLTQNLDRAQLKPLVKAELWLELCCNDKPLHPKATLGTVRHLMWKSGGDLVLTFRRKENK